MKTIKTGIIICTALLAMTSCKKGGVFCYKADGNVVTEERIHTGFTSVSVDNSAELYIEQGENYSVKIETSENLLEIIETKVDGSTLEIDLKKRKCISGDYQIKVYVTMPTIKGLSVSGSGDVYAFNRIDGLDLDLAISGSGSMILDSLDYSNIESSISGSGDVYLYAIDTLDYQELHISGSGKIEGFHAPTKIVDVHVSGSGECQVNATEQLDVSISGSGDVIYKGNPIIDQSVSGSGSIRPF